MRNTDTIFALATPPGRSAIAVFRVSGPRSTDVLSQLTRADCPPARLVSLRALWDGDGRRLDEALVTYFAAPHSYTGEDSVELSVHGGRAVTSAVARSLGAMPGLRQAEPGEFTRRAFLHGKLDLSQAEAVADLIDSETEFQLRLALRMLGGVLERKVAPWRGKLLTIAGQLESAIDFSDEGDVGNLAAGLVVDACLELEKEFDAELAAGSRSLALRGGFTVVIAGPPNAGKSTILNTLAGEDLAIVTEHAGTTRDLISVRLDLQGAPVTIVDTAGLRSTADPVEQIGISRTIAAAKAADLIVWVRSIDADQAPIERFDCDVLEVWNKADLASGPETMLNLSAIDSGSILMLADRIRERAVRLFGDGLQGSLIRERQRECLLRGIAGLRMLRHHLIEGRIELAAEESRTVNEELSRICGRFDAEHVLDEVFSRFCIGK